VLLEADAWLELPPGGWDAWIASLPSKRRINVRREARRFQDAGYTVTHLPLTECYEQLPALAGATQAKYGHAAAAADWLAVLKLHIAAMGSAAQVALCTRGGGEPVGFCLYYVWGETLYLRWGGFDYDRLVGAAEYFNVLYYSQVSLAPKLGVRWIHAGIKSLEAKALRGAELRPLWLVDLAEDSVLARHGHAVRRHNRHAYERLAADGRTRSALRDRDAWLAFS
jgi:predicted N-acyltransferase